MGDKLMDKQLLSLLSSSSKNCIVSGSKENPVFTIHDPDLFVGVHGGIAHAQSFSSHTVKCGVMVNPVLCSAWPNSNRLRRIVEGVHLDYAIVIEYMNPKYADIPVEDLVDIPSKRIIRIKPIQASALELRYLGLDYLKREVLSMPPKKICGWLLQFIMERTTYKTRLSTGVWVLLYLYNHMSKDSTIEVAGIGLQGKGRYFYDSPSVTEWAGLGHVTQDLYISRKLTKSSRGPYCRFTDTDAINNLSIFA